MTRPGSAQFLLDESDSAKYVWKMCVLQHTFYKLHNAAATGSTDSNELNITLDHQVGVLNKLFFDFSGVIRFLRDDSPVIPCSTD